MVVEEEERMTVEEEGGKEKVQQVNDEKEVGEERVSGSPKRYVPLCDLYSSTSPQKVMALKLNEHSPRQSDVPGADIEEQVLPQARVRIYSRRTETPKNCQGKLSDLDALMADANLQAASSTAEEEVKEIIEEGQSQKEIVQSGVGILTRKKKMDMREITEQIELEGDLHKLHKAGGSREISSVLRRRRNSLYSDDDQNPDDQNPDDQNPDDQNPDDQNPDDPAVKKWVQLMLREGDANKLVGLKCKIYWPLDEEWYKASIKGYNEDTTCHHIAYEDGVEEHLLLYEENFQIFISGEELQKLSLIISTVTSDNINENDLNETTDASSDTIDNELGPGDIIWAKLSGHPAWPAIVLRDDLIYSCKGLNGEKAGDKSFSVQFFGSHNFARVDIKQTISLSEGISSGLHIKCKKPAFMRGLEEIRPYLCKQKLPKNMILMQNNTKAEVCERRNQDDEDNGYSDEHCLGDEDMHTNIESSESFLLQIGELKVINLGKIVDSKHFQNENFIWPEGYTAVRKLPSLKDPNVCTTYKMEVMRDTNSRTLPLFKVTLDTGEQFEGFTPSSCWRKIYNSINDTDYSSYHSFISEGNFRPGSDMFGFSCPEVLNLIKSL